MSLVNNHCARAWHARGQPRRPSHNANRPLRKKLAPKIFAVRRQLYMWEHSVDRKPPCIIVFCAAPVRLLEISMGLRLMIPLGLINTYKLERIKKYRSYLFTKILLIFTYQLSKFALTIRVIRTRRKILKFYINFQIISHFRSNVFYIYIDFDHSDFSYFSEKIFYNVTMMKSEDQ